MIPIQSQLAASTAETPIITPVHSVSNLGIESVVHERNSSVTEGQTFPQQQNQMPVSRTLHTPFDQLTRKEFQRRIYAITVISIVLACCQWLTFGYWVRSCMPPIQALVVAFVLTITFFTMLAVFVVFKAQLHGTCYSWIVLIIIEECLVLLTTVNARLTWEYVFSPLAIFIVCSFVGSWSPGLIAPNVIILMSCAGVTIIAAGFTIFLRLGLPVYITICIANMIFVPWTIYNSQRVHGQRSNVLRRKEYLYGAILLFVSFAGLVFTSYWSIFVCQTVFNLGHGPK